MGQPADSFRCRDDVIFRQLDDEWVLFDPKANKIHTLNLTAALVWSYLSDNQDEASIVELVVGSFGDPVPPEQVRMDVTAAIEQFRSEGLLA